MAKTSEYKNVLTDLIKEKCFNHRNADDSLDFSAGVYSVMQYIAERAGEGELENFEKEFQGNS